MKTTSGQDALTTRAATDWRTTQRTYPAIRGTNQLAVTPEEFDEALQSYAELHSRETVNALKDLKAWLKYHLEANTITQSTGKGGHDGDGSSWAAAAIPTWDARQRIDEIDAAILQAERGQ